MPLLQLRRLLSIGTALVLSTSAVVAVADAAPQHTQSIQPIAKQADIDWSAVEQALGKTGQMMPGNVLRINMPRTALNVTVEGVPVKAGFALGSYAAFKPMDDGSGSVMLMGDLVLLDEEVQGVMSGVLDSGLQVAAVYMQPSALARLRLLQHLGHTGQFNNGVLAISGRTEQAQCGASTESPPKESSRRTRALTSPASRTHTS